MTSELMDLAVSLPFLLGYMALSHNLACSLLSFLGLIAIALFIKDIFLGVTPLFLVDLPMLQ